MAVKVLSFFGLFYFDSGTITFPLAYMLGDVLTEIWGYRTARKTIFLAFACNLFVVFWTQIAVWLPAPDYLDETARSFDTVFNYVPRIVIGSLTGFLMGELSNSWLMDRIRINRDTMELEDAVDQAISDVPEDYIMKPFLIAHQAEVKGMLLTEYDEVEQMELFKEDGRKEGRAEGRKEMSEEKDLSGIRNLMETLKLTAKQAMDALKIPDDKQAKYTSMI
jgi:uncharacterized integral membrane protein (TIGR00697 family)